MERETISGVMFGGRCFVAGQKQGAGVMFAGVVLICCYRPVVVNTKVTKTTTMSHNFHIRVGWVLFSRQWVNLILQLISLHMERPRVLQGIYGWCG